MHELSLAGAVLEIAEEKRREAGATSIVAIALDIGQLSCIEPMAMEFAMAALLPDSTASKATVDYHFTVGQARCEDCGEEFELDFLYDPCPGCAGFRKDILAGDEMLVTSVTVA